MNPNESQTHEVEVIQASAVESMTRAEIDVAIATARKYARQPAVIKSRLLTMSTLDTETAALCFYTIPRGGKEIQGPSVRMAEFAVAAFGNLRISTRIIQTVAQGENPHVVIQAVAMDLENNNVIAMEKRRRITKKRNRPDVDDDDINLAVNAATSIAFRDVVFKVVPMSYIKPAFEQCKKVAIGDAKTIKTRVADCVAAFAKMGVTAEQILAYIEKKTVEEIDAEDIAELIGIFNAIREGRAIEEYFKPAPAATPKTTAPAAANPPAPAQPLKQPEKAQEKSAEASAKPKDEPVVQQPAQTPATPEPQPEAKQEAAAAPVATPETPKATETAKTAAPEPSADPDKDCKEKAEALGLTEIQVLRYLQSMRPPMARGTQTKFTELAPVKLRNVLTMMDKGDIVAEMRKMKAD